MKVMGYLAVALASLVVGIIVAGGTTWPGLLRGDYATWLTTRTFGIVAYLLLAASTVWGLLTSSRVLSRWLQPPFTLELHRVFSFLSLAALSVHGGVLLFDQVEPFTVPQLIVPFISDYRPVSVAMGILGGYLSAVLTWSFYLRKRIKQKAWRSLHYSAFAAFGLATVHGILAGSDTGLVWVQVMYLAAGASVLFLTLVRILGGRYVPERKTPRRTRIKLTADS